MCSGSMAVRWAFVRSNHVKEGFFSRLDGLKRGVCASDELETKMRAAYDRVGRGIEGVIGGTCL